MSSRVLPNNSALISKEIWTAAIVQHERIWDADEREIYDGVQARSTDAILRACKFYRVVRTLSRDGAVRQRLQEQIYGARITGVDSRMRLQSFAQHVEKIACDIGRLPPQNGRRPISAVSKLLVQLHPIDGFIYDKNARMTMKQIVGTQAKNDALEAYWAFVQSYSELFCELKTRIAEVLKDQKLTLHPTRIIDKFLWLQGTTDAKKRVNELVKDSKRAHRKVASEIVLWYTKHQQLKD
jgi:hypothetical protein